MSKTPELYSVEETSNLTKLTEKQLREQARKGRMPCVRVTPHALAFLKSDIDAMVQKAVARRKWRKDWGPDPLEEPIE